MRDRLPSQKLGMAYAKKRNTIDLWMEQRTGKTGLAIEWAKSRYKANKVLIVTPKPVTPNWREELSIYGHTDVWIPSNKQLIDDVPQWTITNYEKLYERNTHATTPSPISLFPWDAVILDESVKIKNPQAKATKIALRYLAKAKYKAGLSGLPNPEGTQDLVTQLLFTRGEFMGCDSYWTWDKRYMRDAPSGFGRVPIGKYRSTILAEAYGEAFVLRARDVGLDTDIEYSTIHCDLPRSVISAMKTAKEMRVLNGERLKYNVQVESALHRLAGGIYPGHEHNVKAEIAANLVQGLDKVVVWFRFNDEINRVANLLDPLQYYVLTGKQTPEQRHEIIQKWDRPILLYQIAAATHGINLSACDNFIYYSNYWDLDTRRQSEARGKHANKKHAINITDIVGVGTPDQRIVNAMQIKNYDADALHSILVKELAK